MEGRLGGDSRYPTLCPRPEPRECFVLLQQCWVGVSALRFPSRPPLSQPPDHIFRVSLIEKYSCPYKNLCSGAEMTRGGLRNCQSSSPPSMANTIPLEAIYISNLVRSLLPLLYSSWWRRCGWIDLVVRIFFCEHKNT